jgi:hypothetical protein
MYKRLLPNPFTQVVDSVVRVADGACIPFDPDNTDYQQYLTWLSEGNEPLPADEGESN